MGSRFGDIQRGPELQDAYNKLDAWRKLPTAQKKAAYAAVAKPAADRVKTERVIVWIQPFGASRDGIYYETKIPAAAQAGEGGTEATAVRALIDGRFTAAAPAGATDVIIEMPKFRFAQVRISRKTGEVPNSVSRITGRPYKKIRTNSMSGSFGKNAAQNDYFAAVKAIKALPAYTNFANTAGNSISFRPEGG